MAKLAIVKTGGKQYLVKESDEIVVDKIDSDQGKKVELETLALIDSDKGTVDLGTPVLKASVQGQIVENLKGDKVRTARFKAKVRYRKVTGFRPQLSKVKILKI